MGRPVPLRVLIVEDDPILAMELEHIVEGAGSVAIGVAAKPVDAISMAAEFGPDLVLMDVRLQGQADGIGTAYAIQAYRDTPVLFVTALKDEDTAKRVEAFNGSEPLIKPVDPERLSRAMLYAAKSDVAVT
jgi:CheY-like chemotaxis protein